MEEVINEQMLRGGGGGDTEGVYRQQQQQQHNVSNVTGNTNVNTNTNASSVSEEADIVSMIRDYIRMDNTRRGLADEVKQMKEPAKLLKEGIIRYMSTKTIIKIPTKKNGEEYIELKAKTKNRKPTRDEMVYNLRMLMQTNEVLDRSPEDIIEFLVKPVVVEETYDLCRKCKRKRNTKKKTTDSSASTANIANTNTNTNADANANTEREENGDIIDGEDRIDVGQGTAIHCLRDLLVRNNSNGMIQEDTQPQQPPLKRRNIGNAYGVSL